MESRIIKFNWTSAVITVVTLLIGDISAVQLKHYAEYQEIGSPPDIQLLTLSSHHDMTEANEMIAYSNVLVSG